MKKKRPPVAVRLRPHRNPATELAPLFGFDPAVLKGGPRKADSFVLLLAVVYNDLRELQWVAEHLTITKPVEVVVSRGMGDWQGATVWTKRYAAAVLNELMVAVKHAHKAGILGQSMFIRTAQALDDQERVAWNNIVDVAMGRPGTASALRAFFDRVRNRAAFHFDRGQLWEGYQAHFHRRKKDAFNEQAYMSVGRTLGATRFYFADAAAQLALELYDTKGELWPLVNQVTRSVNVALRAVVDTHVRFRMNDARQESGAR